MICKRCASKRIKKNGFREGKHCYFCGECHNQFISELGRHTLQEEQVAVLLYCLGLSFSAISQVLFVHPSAVLRWVRKYAHKNCKKPIPQGEIVVELDEMWDFVHSKKTKSGFGKLIVAQAQNSSTGSLVSEAVKHFGD